MEKIIKKIGKWLKKNLDGVKVECDLLIKQEAEETCGFKFVRPRVTISGFESALAFTSKEASVTIFELYVSFGWRKPMTGSRWAYGCIR